MRAMDEGWSYLNQGVMCLNRHSAEESIDCAMLRYFEICEILRLPESEILGSPDF